MTQSSSYTKTYLVVCNDCHFGPEGIESLKSAGFVEAAEPWEDCDANGYKEHYQTVYHRNGVAVYVANSYDNAVAAATKIKPDTIFIDSYADKKRADYPVDFAKWVVTDALYFSDTQLVCVGLMAAQTKISIATRAKNNSDDRLIVSNSSVAAIISSESARATKTRWTLRGPAYGDLVYA